MVGLIFGNILEDWAETFGRIEPYVKTETSAPEEIIHIDERLLRKSLSSKDLSEYMSNENIFLDGHPFHSYEDKENQQIPQFIENIPTDKNIINEDNYNFISWGTPVELVQFTDDGMKGSLGSTKKNMVLKDRINMIN